MLQKIVRFIGGDPNKREIERLSALVNQINSLEPTCENLSDEALRAKTDEFRNRLSEGATLDALLHEAFAVVREASKRTNEQRPFDVQLIGGAVLHQGKIAEMRTGEGKTLVATLPLYLNALTGRGVHLVTVNDYLARRDARWMGAIYTFLGLSVGVLQMAARTENGRNAFLVDPDRRSPHEDQDQLRMVPRAEAYQADITYGTNSEFGFDYLRDNLAMRLSDRVQRGHYFAIVDEVDNILIDEARTPLIISGPASEDTEWYVRMAQIVRQMNPEDYEVNEKDRTVTLNEIGEAHVELLLDTPLRDPERPEDITPEQARLLGYLEKALQAQFLYRRNKDYLVQTGKVIIVDEFTGRLMPGRRWSEGLHQAVEAKEGVKVEPENVTYATITLQNYFRKYEKLSGMTGTALTEAEEFYKIYKLDVLPIPTNLEFQATGKESPLVEVESRDEQGYRFGYFVHRGADEKQPAYWRRKDFPDIVYRSEEAKLRAIVKEIIYYYVKGRPQLVGTTSVEHSERLSDNLSSESVRRLLQTMLIRQAWLEKNNRQDDERAIPELKPLWQPVTTLQAADLRQIAKPLGLNSINPEEEGNLPKVLALLSLESGDQARLVSILQGGVPHQVLNARKHDEESQIIAGAGAFGAVTIATNMAGRGVDIKLGGELPEGSLAGVNRILARTGSEDPYDMTMEEREAGLKALTLEDFGIYEEDARTFLNYMENSRRVRQLGGLHVIGSERHEARRIDNQLRGRSARQGDPGSSRFFLSLDDELMRLFGGGQVEGLMSRLKIDEAIPIESGMVGRLVEQSQTRVEGANFDVRKHLLEYDDVLNTQRERIYSQRDRIFQKSDLHEDVSEMLRTELQQRIPEALADAEGPWKLLAYLDEVQPPLDVSGVVFPSFGYRLVLEQIGTVKDAAELRSRLLKLADDVFKAEQEHLLSSIRTLLEKTEETLKIQIQEREDGLETFIEGQKDAVKNSDESTPTLTRRPQEIQDELVAAIRTPVRLNGPQLRQLASNPADIEDELRLQISAFVTGMVVNRLVNTIERRVEEALPSKPTQLLMLPYREIADRLLQETDNLLEQRGRRLLGEQGQIARDLDSDPSRLQRAVEEPTERTRLLNLMAQGTKLSFDAKTHRRGFTLTTRLRYPYRAAQLIEQADPQAVTGNVVSHLEEAEQQVAKVWGLAEWNRVDRDSVTVGLLDNATQQRLQEEWGKEGLDELRPVALANLHPDNQDELIKIIGQRIQNEIYRQLLLNVISDLWVDYLTRVEALRVSIGLEAYAQRDPLVQYKGQASEMFTTLLREIRAGVISRMFVYRPRQAVQSTPAEARIESQPAAAVSSGAGPAPRLPDSGGSKKKKRKRH